MRGCVDAIQVCAFGAHFFMPAKPARRFAPIKTGIVPEGHTS